jgi:uncharacterized protein (TIGR02466 family)
MQVVNIFPCAMFEGCIKPETAQVVEDYVVPKLDLLTESPDTFDHHSTDFWDTKILVHEHIPQFWDEVLECIKQYSAETSLYVNFEGLSMHYWTQDYKEGDGHDIHAHGGPGISGIYWVRANEAAGSVRFYTPNPYTDLSSWTDQMSPYARPVVDVFPEKGKLVLFPSYLKHRVMPSGPDAIRTAIAFNVK